MSKHQPTTIEELKALKGVTDKQATTYGAAFLRAIEGNKVASGKRKADVLDQAEQPAAKRAATTSSTSTTSRLVLRRTAVPVRHAGNSFISEED